jgi:hypothetical protein
MQNAKAQNKGLDSALVEKSSHDDDLFVAKRLSDHALLNLTAN